MAVSPWQNDLTERLTGVFGAAILETSSYLGQHFVVVEPAVVVDVIRYLKTEEAYDFLVDLTAVDFPQRPARFELVYNLYSFASNTRLRVKTRVAEADRPQSLTSVFPGANWLEREIFDMFGVEFAGHPEMRRILLPDEWQGHPLRKDHSITGMDQQWVQDNLGIESGQ